MKLRNQLRRLFMIALVSATLMVPAGSFDKAVHMVVATTATTARQEQADITINGFFAADKVRQGRTVQAAIVLDIPAGYHVNAHRPFDKFSIPTVVQLDASGVRLSPVSYPRPTVRRLSFSNEPLALYEGRTVLRFNVTVPANHQTGILELKARVSYQRCNDEVCFPPAKRDLTIPLMVVSARETVKRINGEYFGKRK
ncbi:MAG: hypothetical protein H0T45_09155 [Pyrinomonadaceae bacterium]|nr:hypothetical protein [Pyrinomonadaceae bacterium]